MDELLHEGYPVVRRKPTRITTHRTAQATNLLGQSLTSLQLADSVEYSFHKSVYTVGTLEDGGIIFRQRFFGHIPNDGGVQAITMDLLNQG